jgi:hypothetical protein
LQFSDKKGEAAVKNALSIFLKITLASIFEIAWGLVMIPIKIIGGFLAFGFAAFGVLKLIVWFAGH